MVLHRRIVSVVQFWESVYVQLLPLMHSTAHTVHVNRQYIDYTAL